MLSSHARALDIAREKLIVAAKVRSIQYLFITHVYRICIACGRYSRFCHGCIFLLVVNLFVSFCILLVVQLTQTFSFFRLSLLIVVYLCV